MTLHERSEEDLVREDQEKLAGVEEEADSLRKKELEDLGLFFFLNISFCCFCIVFWAKLEKRQHIRSAGWRFGVTAGGVLAFCISVPAKEQV